MMMTPKNSRRVSRHDAKFNWNFKKWDTDADWKSTKLTRSEFCKHYNNFLIWLFYFRDRQMISVSSLSRPVARLSRPETKVLLVKRWFVCWNMIYEIKFWDSSGRCLDNMLKVIFVICCCSLILAKRQIPVGRRNTKFT